MPRQRNHEISEKTLSLDFCLAYPYFARKILVLQINFPKSDKK
jgi:hypothetical protein